MYTRFSVRSAITLAAFACLALTPAAHAQFTTLDDPLATGETVAIGISGSNIVGLYNDNTGVHGFLYRRAAVPEPGSVALLIGLVVTGAGFLRKRRNRS